MINQTREVPKFELMAYNDQVADVVWNEEMQQFYLRRRANVMYPVTLFGCQKWEVPMYEAIAWACRRCFPKERMDCKELLAELGLERYDAWEIIQITRCSMHSDPFWLRREPDDEFYRDTIGGYMFRYYETQQTESEDNRI